MSRLTDLLRAAKQLDPQLGADLEEELKPLQKRLPFGLNFERHAPEVVELPGHGIRKASKVRVLSPRGSTARGDQRLWRVDSLIGDVAEISLIDAAEPESTTAPVDDLLLVAEFRDRIYPGLRPDGTIERGGDKPFHTVINGENFHVLEQLTFTHERAVDAIYIDPPYNTGSRDWKYNNDYVEGDDLYRHSKWLAFMERRLNVARRLLNPNDSVLIVTIDEKEYLRLGLLLEQTFPEARIQMVTTVISQRGVARDGSLARVDEYVFLVLFGRARASESKVDLLGSVSAEKTRQVWFQFRRNGSGSLRSDSPNLFYPLLIDPETRIIREVGDPLAPSEPRSSFAPPEGLVAVWPLREDGTEARWRTGVDIARRNVSRGYLRVGAFNSSKKLWPVLFINEGGVKAIEKGEIETVGRAESGEILLGGAVRETVLPKTVWNSASHDAGWHGSRLLSAIIPSRTFPYPKSLYAVEDVLRLFISEKPDAVVLDFFSGSGTTAHAVMRLNKQDDGRRQCISVTNNEVSAEEQTQLRKQNLRPGDALWETHGICGYITKPRIRAVITGKTPEGDLIKGDYKFVDEFPMADGFEENAAFFTLTYESPWMVGSGHAFSAIAPMLWLRAGARGNRIDAIEEGWAVAETYGILRDLDKASEFTAALEGVRNLRIVYIVTDDEGRYQQVADQLRGVETVRLYEDYLRNCESTGDF